MVFGRITDAVSDLTETLRRVFQDPPSHVLEPGHLAARADGVPALAAKPRLPAFELAALSIAADLQVRPEIAGEPMVFVGRCEAESGWARWVAGARILEMERFAAGGQRRVEVPPLPRRPACARVAPEAFRTVGRSASEAFVRPAVRGGSPEITDAVVKRSLDQVMGLPIAVQGQDVQELPRVQWMRYSLQLVKATGENIRNLDVLGLYRIPERGVKGMRHDARSGRLLLELSREAAGAARLPFLLARRKDDRTLVSCFLEEG